MDSMSGHELDESNASDWEQIPLPKALSKLRDETQVAHCMLWFRTTQSHNAFSFLQLRFDGLLGFPGGVVDEDITSIESIIDALQREIHEEINFETTISVDDYIYSFYNKNLRIVSHFFAKQITLKDAESIEECHMKARDFPHESLGLFRIPIGCSYNRDSYYLRRFAKNFLRQKFSGNVKKQIIDVCEKFKIMSSHDLNFFKAQLQ
ncbi:U8 snoRNA-decapping enzyme-like [Oppia nitens]|uniref:U8 snoRNA-decapping enzyme-like n=1 Tax=Oppia nitens TaxID=1686743 RepID=UPI0023DBD26D|nr:U8 snoRNA-decapping enzyme-like [Oppia nitens]